MALVGPKKCFKNAPFWHWMDRSTNGRFWSDYAGATFNDKGGNRTFAAVIIKVCNADQSVNSLHILRCWLLELAVVTLCAKTCWADGGAKLKLHDAKFYFWQGSGSQQSLYIFLIDLNLD
jgi:hypothetical protein